MRASDPVLMTRIAEEYREMPGLCLTAAEGPRLWGLDVDECRRLLRRLVATGLLRCLPPERYVAARGGSWVRHDG